MTKSRGYTLIELMVSVGIFALIMTLASGAYLIIIGVNRQVQATAVGIDNLSFVLEDMTRSIRTGTGYGCNGAGDCAAGGSSFTFTSSTGGGSVTYTRGTQSGPDGTVGDITVNGTPITDSTVNIGTLTFYTSGTATTRGVPANYEQSHVTIVISGTVKAGVGKTLSFSVETAATMRGSDI